MSDVEENYDENINNTENLIESTENCTNNEDQENVEVPLENPICILLDQRSDQKRPVGITELRKLMKEADFQWNYTRLPLPSDYENEYDPGCDVGCIWNTNI